MVKTHRLWDQYANTRTGVCIVRPKNIPRDVRVSIARVALGYTDRKYGWWKLALHFGDKLLNGAYFFRRLARWKKYPICSFVVADSYAAKGYTFGVAPGEAQPDDIWDYVMNSDNYTVVRPMAPLQRRKDFS